MYDVLFNDTSTAEIFTLSLHDALPILDRLPVPARRLRTLPGIVLWSRRAASLTRSSGCEFVWCGNLKPAAYPARWTDRKSTPSELQSRQYLACRLLLEKKQPHDHRAPL